MAICAPELMPLVWRTKVPKTPSFVEMIDNMSKVEPIERDKLWALISTVAHFDWLGASPILREAITTRVPDVITIDGKHIEFKTADRWRRSMHVTLDLDMLGACLR